MLNGHMNTYIIPNDSNIFLHSLLPGHDTIDTKLSCLKTIQCCAHDSVPRS